MSTRRPISIFDVDGTLSSCDWRRHLVETARPNWREFFALQSADAPIEDVVRELSRRKNAGHEIVLVTGRPDQYRYVTEFWLAEHRIEWDRLLMRRSDDQRPDPDVKEDMLLSHFSEQSRITQVFDDNPDVIKVWIAHGLDVVVVEDPCLPGLMDRE